MPMIAFEGCTDDVEMIRIFATLTDECKDKARKFIYYAGEYSAVNKPLPQGVIPFLSWADNPPA